MKLVLFSDLHLDTPFTWAGPALARSRRIALQETLENILSVASDVKADAILCGGDLYEHEMISPDTEDFLRQSFGEIAPIPVYIAPGNHDWFGPESAYQRIDWSSNVTVFSKSSLQRIEIEDGLSLWGAAHRAPANTDGFLDDFTVDGSGVHLALFHGSELNWTAALVDGKVAHAPFEEKQISDAGFGHAFLGHYHKPFDGPYHTYPGNPDPLTFGETGERGLVVATVGPNGAIESERVSVAVTTVTDLKVDVAGATNGGEVREKVSVALEGLIGVARVTLYGELAEQVDLQLTDLKGIESDLDDVLYEFDRIHVSYDLETIAAEQTVRGQFVAAVLEAGFPEDESQRIITAGLRAFDGRDDLEIH